MEIEYEIISNLAEKRWKLLHELAEVEAAIQRNSRYFYVGDDGLVELGLEAIYGR